MVTFMLLSFCAVIAEPRVHPHPTPFTVIETVLNGPRLRLFVVNTLPVVEPLSTIGRLYDLVILGTPDRLKLP